MNQELQIYIQDRLAQGVLEEVVYKDLRHVGWEVEEIKEAFKSIQVNFSTAEEREEEEDLKDLRLSTKKSTASFLKSSLSLLFKRPVFLLPIFVCWVLVASLALYVQFYLEFPESFGLSLLLSFGILFLVAFIVSIANIMMLELLQHVEDNEAISVKHAFYEAFVLDFFKVVPIAFIWALLWLPLLVLKAAASKSKRKGRRRSVSAKEAALILGGANAGPFSWLRLGLRMLEKVLRMYIFLSLPAIAWEGKSSFAALSHAGKVIRSRPVEFLSGTLLTVVVTLLMVIPLAIIFSLSDEGKEFSTLFWYFVILYEGFIWTLSIYLEQMAVAYVYLRHLRSGEGERVVDTSNIPTPILD